jgi:hypothetical protein
VCRTPCTCRGKSSRSCGMDPVRFGTGRQCLQPQAVSQKRPRHRKQSRIACLRTATGADTRPRRHRWLERKFTRRWRCLRRRGCYVTLPVGPALYVVTR